MKARETNLICGIDEAGRGCAFGSLFVCGVVCSCADFLRDLGVADSKTLSQKRRDEIAKILMESPRLRWHLCAFDAAKIDSVGLSACLKEAICEIVENLKNPNFFTQDSLNDSAHFANSNDFNDSNDSGANLFSSNLATDGASSMRVRFIMDGNTNFGIKGVESLVKGDAKIPQIAAASIIAKFHKDAESRHLDALYPHYKIAQNKGYLSAEHIAAIATYGLTPHHRKTYKIKALERSLF